MLADFQIEIQNTNYEQFLENIDIHPECIKNILVSLWQNKFDNIKREFIDFLEVNLICAELIVLKKYDNYQDHVKQEAIKFIIYRFSVLDRFIY